MAGHGVLPGKAADSDDWPDLREGTRASTNDDDLEEIIEHYMPTFDRKVKQMPALPIPPDEQPIPIEDNCIGEGCLQPEEPPPLACKLVGDCDAAKLISHLAPVGKSYLYPDSWYNSL
jgi:hypothetical protein